MKTTQMIPFERNRYYYGKMLTSPDFRAEQQYMNHKRMFLNQMVLGSGILCGLNVFNLDDLSVLVESGTAIDPLGREIVVDKSVVKKLSALDGYREDTKGSFSLCLRYKEEEVQPVYAVNRKEEQEEYENNRIRENYELFLIDSSVVDNPFQLDSEFFVEAELLKNKDYQVLLKMPASACRGKKIKLSIEVVKLSARETELELSYKLQLPAFIGKDGRKKLEIREQGIALEKGARCSFEYWLYTLRNSLKETSILIKTEKGKETELKILLTDDNPDDLIRQSLGKPSLEIRESLEPHDFVRLADLHMTRTKTACMIEYIEEKQVKNYIPVPADESKRVEYLSYYDAGEWGTEQNPFPENANSPLGHALQSGTGVRPDEGGMPGFSVQPKDGGKPGLCVRPEESIMSEFGTQPEAGMQPEFSMRPEEGLLSDSEDRIGQEILSEEEEASEQQKIYTQSPNREDSWIAGGTLEIPLEQKMKKGSVCFSEEISHGLGPGSVYVAVGVDEPKDGAHAKKQIQSTVYGDADLFAAKEPKLNNVKTAVRVWEERGSFQAAVRLNGEQNTVLLSLHWIAVKIPGLTTDMVLEQIEPMQIAPENVTVNLKPKEKHFFAVKFLHMQPCSLKYELAEDALGKLEEDGTYTAPMKSGVYEIKIYCEDFPEICTYAYAVVSGKR